MELFVLIKNQLENSENYRIVLKFVLVIMVDMLKISN